MARPDVMQKRERFTEELEKTLSNRAIPVEQLSWRDVQDKAASELIVESGGKKRVFTISDSDLVNDVQGQIDLIINATLDNE